MEESFNAFGNAEKKVSPEQDLESTELDLDSIAYQGATVQKDAAVLKAMIAYSIEHGMELGEDISDEIEEVERQAVLLAGSVNKIKTSIYEKGVRMTSEDLDKYKQ